MKFEKINPIALIDENAVLTNLGDISFCYKIVLPELRTISVEKYNAIHQMLLQMFLLLPENVLLHRQDIFSTKSLDVSELFSKEDFFQKSLYNHFQGRNYLSQTSYLYITVLNGFGFNREIGKLFGGFDFLKKLDKPEEFEKKLRDYASRVEKAIATLQEEMKIIPLTEEEITSLIDKHLNGYEENKICSPVFKPKYQIGNKFFASYALDSDLNQKDGDLPLTRINPNMSSEISKMYESYMSVFGYDLGYEHTLNTYIFHDDQAAIKRDLETRRSQLRGFSRFGSSNGENEKRLSEFLQSVEKENVRIVRTHFNITIWDSDEKSLKQKDKIIQSTFGKVGIIPTEYIYDDLRYIYLSSFVGCGGYLPKEYTFISYLNLALCYILYEGSSVINSKEGYCYTNRNNNAPFRIDTFFSPYEDGLIDNRNYFVIAPSGGGKSFSSRNRLLQQYYMGFDQVVINIGGDDKLCRVINSFGKDEALYIEYKEGQTLSINPFYVEDTINNDKIEFLINFIWLLWGGSGDIAEVPDVNSVLNKIIVNYYEAELSNRKEGGFVVKGDRGEWSIQSFYDYLINNVDTIRTYYRNNDSLFKLDSLILNLEKFAIGSYSNLFLRGKPDILSKKKYIEFELDNIKDHSFLFPIFSMVISDITFNTMWSTEGYKDFFIDEAWKILEKKGMSVLLKYLYKTIRKFDGSVGIAVQQITDITFDEVIEEAILGNCSIKHILSHEKGAIKSVPLVKKKLSLSDTQTAMLLSIKNKTDKKSDIRFKEQLLVMGNDFSRVVRVEVSPELATIFDSEKSRLKKFNDIYAQKNNNIEKTVLAYLGKIDENELYEDDEEESDELDKK